MADQRISWEKKLYQPFQSLAVCIGCLECRERKKFDHYFIVSRGRSFFSWPSFLLDSEGWISCSTESFLAIPSVFRRFCMIIKPVEPNSRVFLRGNDVKCHDTALEKGSISDGALE